MNQSLAKMYITGLLQIERKIIFIQEEGVYIIIY